MRRKRLETGGKRMLETVKPAPADAILGLTVAFNKDARPEKINLSVGCLLYTSDAADE